MPVTVKSLKKVKIRANPIAQKIVANLLLRPNYGFLPGIKIQFEGADQIPKHPIIFAMNHTDRYNYWPFQYELWRTTGRMTAIWVKPKYFQNPLMARFMGWTNAIPTPSLGYVITSDFLSVYKRAPDQEEYRTLKDAIQNHLEDSVPTKLRTTPRSILKMLFDPKQHRYTDRANQVFQDMFASFVALNRRAHLELGLDMIVFPQGTRSVRLSQGRVGLGQLASLLDATVVPVGCSGSDKIYPDGIPVARKGCVTYRFGKPMRAPASEKLLEGSPTTELESHDVGEKLRAPLQNYVDDVMNAINGLVDEPYRFANDHQSDGVSGAARFV